MDRRIFRSFGPISVFIVPILLVCFSACKQAPAPQPQPKPKPPAPQIKAPDFSVDSITILQAEIVNTRLKMKLHINNPNPFPVTLSSLSYEFYGEGRFWADGKEKNICVVPASGHAEKDLYIKMNFIDMGRNLFDKIVAMEKVAYRFAGTVEIIAENVPVLAKAFNLEGESEVDR